MCNFVYLLFTVFSSSSFLNNGWYRFLTEKGKNQHREKKGERRKSRKIHSSNISGDQENEREETMFLLLWNMDACNFMLLVICCHWRSKANWSENRNSAPGVLTTPVWYKYVMTYDMTVYISWHHDKIWHINIVQSWSFPECCLRYATGSCMQLYLLLTDRLTKPSGDPTNLVVFFLWSQIL